jgi:hypothetical protein
LSSAAFSSKPLSNAPKTNAHSMSSQMVSLKSLNHATLEGMNACIGEEAALNHQAQKNCFIFFNMDSIWIYIVFDTFSANLGYFSFFPSNGSYVYTNQIQREFSSNVAIASQD